MIISVEELKSYITTDEKEPMLEAKLQALELLIRNHTNNNFQHRNIRTQCPIMAQKLYTSYPYFAVGDTIQISESIYSNGIFVIKEITDGFITLDKNLLDEAEVLVTKVEYPADVKMGVVEIMDWKQKNKDKAGLSSETISRHSQTFDRASMNKEFGVPNELIGFLKDHMKARF